MRDRMSQQIAEYVHKGGIMVYGLIEYFEAGHEEPELQETGSGQWSI
jgi:hypothetical protein